VSVLLLDTTVVIDVERGAAALDDVIADDDDTAIAAVTVAELQVGALRADGVRRDARQGFIDAVVGVVPVISYDLSVAMAHARLLAATGRRVAPWCARSDHRGHRGRRWPHGRHRRSVRLRGPAGGGGPLPPLGACIRGHSTTFVWWLAGDFTPGVGN
jgi:tRNA(fMet)-specific endonuclease VapC